jgi:pyruvate dehydrogenase E1 component
MRQVPDQIAQWVPARFASLGADGFGFSDTRAAARRFFHIDGPSMAVRALQMLAEEGQLDWSVAREAAERYRLLDVEAGASGSTGGES